MLQSTHFQGIPAPANGDRIGGKSGQNGNGWKNKGLMIP